MVVKNCDAPVSNYRRLHPEEEARRQTMEDIMKTIISALIALAVLAGVTAPAGAGVDPKKLYDQLDRQKY